MISKLIKNIRQYSLAKQVNETSCFYESGWDVDKIAEYQLNSLNKIWYSAIKNVPYYREIKISHELPEKFTSLDQFRSVVPFLDKPAIISSGDRLSNSTKTPDLYMSTGGSTAEPIKVPVWNSETIYSKRNIWYARSWYGIKPKDKLFLFWGHSHIFGDGLKGIIKKHARTVKDYLLGYLRFSAYDLSGPNMKNAAAKMLLFKPAYLIGYSVALDRFSRINEGREDLGELDIKAVISTAESFPTPESRKNLSKLFNTKVVMEYGSVETGPIAYEKEEERYMVFWRDFFVEAVESDQVPGKYELVITTLFERCLPLIRYKIGDIVEKLPDTNISVGFKSITGRCNDYINLKNGKIVHSEVFSHILRSATGIHGFRVVQDKGGINLFYTAESELDAATIKKLRQDFLKIDQQFDELVIQRTQKLEKTIAGKVRTVIRADNV